MNFSAELLAIMPKNAPKTTPEKKRRTVPKEIQQKAAQASAAARRKKADTEVMKWLEAYGEWTPTREISKRRGVSQGSQSTMLKSMHQRGLIEMTKIKNVLHFKVKA